MAFMRPESSMQKHPPASFWTDDLGLNVTELVERLREKRADWIGNRNGRQLKIICEALAIEGERLPERRAALDESDDDVLLPFFLVDQFARFKSRVAVLELAREILAEDRLGECMKSNDVGDTTALLLALFVHRWELLKDVALLDRRHKLGFAGMRLRGGSRKPKRSLVDVLKAASLRSVLAAADAAARDRLKTEYRGRLDRDGRVLVFMRRADRPDHMVRSKGGVLHGYKPEWIILDFEPDCHRVRIASRTASVPLQIANGIATACFDKDCGYVNESDPTPRDTLETFVAHLRAEAAGLLTLVELSCKSAPLDGAPSIRISQPDSVHIGSSLQHFERSVGPLDLDHIDSVKVLYGKKRVTISFEQADDGTDAFDVRYSDHRLNALEREQFVALLKETHGITIHSTEKRYARSS